MVSNTTYSAFVRHPFNICHSSLYLNKESSFVAFVIYVKLSFTAEGQTPGKVDNTEENPGLEEKDA